ncbi:hypothetical protein PABG_05635 [Paracoccidioides brasiliensis Pb03]|nr:hypothetical protein PABG_05635 [Paracoccidioides brasiliensis Pb03]
MTRDGRVRHIRRIVSSSLTSGPSLSTLANGREVRQQLHWVVSFQIWAREPNPSRHARHRSASLCILGSRCAGRCTKLLLVSPIAPERLRGILSFSIRWKTAPKGVIPPAKRNSRCEHPTSTSQASSTKRKANCTRHRTIRTTTTATERRRSRGAVEVDQLNSKGCYHILNSQQMLAGQLILVYSNLEVH